MRAVLTIAHLTLAEARRRRILAAALVLGAAFVLPEAVRLQLIGMGVKSVLVTAEGITGEKELDGRVDMILSPVVEQKG